MKNDVANAAGSIFFLLQDWYKFGGGGLISSSVACHVLAYKVGLNPRKCIIFRSTIVHGFIGWLHKDEKKVETNKIEREVSGYFSRGF